MMAYNKIRRFIHEMKLNNVWQVAKLFALASICFALAIAAIQLTRGDGRIAAVWPVNAVLLVILLKHNNREWASLLLSFSGGLICANLSAGDSLPRAFWFTTANIAEILTIALIVTHRRRARMISTRGISLFVAATIVGCVISTGLAVLALAQSGSAPGLQDAVLWYSADFLGMVLFAPVAWSLLDKSRKFRADGIDRLTILSFILLCSVSLAVFMQSDYPLLFLVPPALVAMAFTSGIKGAAVGLLIVAGFAFPLTLAGQGPTSLMNTDMKSKELVLQAFLATNSIMALGVGAAVSDRRRLVAKLARSQGRLRIRMREMKEALGKAHLAEKMSGVGHWTLDPETSRVFWSPEVYAIHGVEPGEFDPSYSDAIDFYAEHDKTMVDGLVAEGIAHGKSWEFEATIIRQSDGEKRRVQSFGECIMHPNGKVDRICGVFRDITEETRLISELADREHQYRMLAEFSTDIVVQFGFDGKITYVSPSCRILGVTQQDAIGMSTLDFVVEEDKEFATVITSDLFSEDDPDRTVRREFRVRTVNGDIIWLEGNPTLIRDEDGKPLYAVSTFRDVTDRRAREEALALARVEAEVATKAKADFLSNMSHEIRTPLNGILGFTQLMTKTELGEEQSYYLERVTQAGHMLRHIVDDILDFSKIEAGQMILAPSRIFFNEVVVDCAELVRASRQNTAVSLEIDLATDSNLLIVCDETRLRQILVNLIGNALKFTKAGRVSVTAQLNGQDILIAVEDTGPGIPADKQELVFEGFQQADSTVSRKFGGTGLGLSISRSLAELMGGELTLRSIEGEGTTVTLVLPGIAAGLGHEGEGQMSLAPDYNATASVMVVDDVELNLELLEIGLSEYGHHVTGFSSASDALDDLASGARYDLVLMDIQMPGMDGLTAIRRIRASFPEIRDTPIFALTAQALPEQVKEIQKAGFDDHVAKPVDIESLHKLICSTVGGGDGAPAIPVSDQDAVRTEYAAYLQSMRVEFDQLLALPQAEEAASAVSKLAGTMANAADALGLNMIASQARHLSKTAHSAFEERAPASQLEKAIVEFYDSTCSEAA